MSPDQREQLAVWVVSGATEGPDAWLGRRRLEFGRDLAQRGRIGEADMNDAVAEARGRCWPGLGEPQPMETE